jgi:heterodisulfide reductase subunit C
VARQDVELVWEQVNKDVWDCSQCFSCLRCPRGNNPGGIITIMREVAVNNGLRTAKEALEGYGRIIYKIMGTGTQVSPDMIQPEAFPDWGPDTREISANLQLWRKALPPETLHTTSTAWDVDDKTLTELYNDLAHDRRVGHDQEHRPGLAPGPRRRHGRAARREGLPGLR